MLGGLLVLTALTYHGVVRNGFVWDDAYVIVNNPAIDSFASAWRWVTEPEATSSLREANYRPVLVASFALDVALWGRDPAGFHATNLAIHLAVVLLAFLLALRLWQHPWSAVAAAAVLALHPINAEAVNYVSARSSLLATALTLAALWVWDVRERTGPKIARSAASLALGLLALGAKESAVILPLLIVIWDRLRAPANRPWRASLMSSTPWWGLVAAYLAWRHDVLAGSPPARLVGDGAWQPALFTLKILLASLWHWFLPLSSAVDHGWLWRIGPAEAAALLAGGLAATAATVVLFRFDRRIGWCGVWFWAALLPLAALPWVSRLTLYQDHRVYLAGVGLAWAAGDLLRRAGARLAAQRPAAIGAGAVAIFVAAAAMGIDAARTTVWRDADRLWAHAVARYPNSVLGRNHQALRWLETGQVARARDELEASVNLAPDFPVTHNYLGVAYARLGDLDRAATEFQTAVRLNPFFTSARLNLGNAYEQTGRWDLALAAYEQGVPDEPWAVDLMERAARLLTRMGKGDEATTRYQKILALDPNHRVARTALDQSPR